MKKIKKPQIIKKTPKGIRAKKTKDIIESEFQLLVKSATDEDDLDAKIQAFAKGLVDIGIRTGGVTEKDRKDVEDSLYWELKGKVAQNGA